MKFSTFPVATLVLAVLTGCGTTTLSFGPSAKNPNSYGVVQFRQPAPMAVIVTEEEAGSLNQFRYTCHPGHELGYELLKNDQGKEIRRWQCRTPEGIRIAIRTLVAHGGNLHGGGGNSPQGLFRYGTRVDCPQVPVGNGLARCQ